MGAFLLYIVKSSCCLVSFYLGYKTLLSHETCFCFNRRVLMGGMIACLLLPLIEWKTATPGIIQQPFIELERMIVWEEPAAPPMQAVAENIAPVSMQQGNISTPLLSLVLYLAGCGVTLVLLIRSFISLFVLIQRGAKIRTGGYVLILLNQHIPPFNWWKYIILSEKDHQTYPDEILTHELAHYHKRHSFDLAFAECVILLHWFNPAAWLLKRELQDVHEYEADTEVLKSGIDATKYQLLLVKKAVGSSSYTFANSFNQSKLKKRITMMCKDQSNKWARWKLVLLIPVAACTVYAFARPDVSRQSQQLIPSESTTIPQDNKQSVTNFSDSETKGPVVVAILYDGDTPKATLTVSSAASTFSTYSPTGDLDLTQILKSITHIGVTAPKDTPMGMITDAKNMLHQIWEERGEGLDMYGIKITYH